MQGDGTQNRQNVEIYTPFLQREIRSQFVRKVYIILAVQLVFTFAFVAFCIFTPPVRDALTDPLSFIGMIIAGVLMLVVILILTCVEKARKTFPINYILLALYTATFTYMCGGMSVYYETIIVLVTIGAVTLICIMISIIAIVNCVDITSWWMYLHIFSMVFFGFGSMILIMSFFFQSPILYLVYAGIATLLTCFFFLFDTQMILGRGKYSLSPDEYILGALSLYADICTMFIYILTIIGGATGR